MRLQHCF